METKEIIKHYRLQNHLSQEELAQKVFVTRQAVSRWETGETLPNTETLKQLSKLFNLSINTLLGSPRQLVCQCCGMPLNEDSYISKESDGNFNENYCTWCYDQDKFVYPNKAVLIDFLVEHMPNPTQKPKEQLKQEYDLYLSTLEHWKEKP